ncbi:MULTISPECIES: ABC transporter permease [unclassified Modestobacter]|uniref:ABC transporter permease n=1 Tax=unclassified Modestobacter TaxID=2643866 RepID=UPI0022AAC43D|nr:MULTISPECIES: ABC transporter permease [unclassified Modestobacter]MCZ2823345.1 ABC transporter permease [Modestobacter sp. VKM Ac-2981]MCZ2851590.1 ABC transporter permease [Modestobacter sp. VKM Ac-2982]
MSTTLAPAPSTPSAPARLRRVAALARGELRLFLRNRTAVANSGLLPLLLVAAVPALGIDGELPLGPRLLVAAVGVTLVFVTYYNLVITFVARREEMVLQRMRTGELTGLEVLVGTAVPTLLVTLAQVALVAVGVVVLGEWSAPVEFLLPVIALLGGALLMTVLAAASTSFTRSAESAQVTTLPLVVVTSALSGLLTPLSVFPEPVALVARLMPVTPVVELLQLGLAGVTWDGESVDAAGAWGAAPLPLAVLAGWLVIGTVAATRGFRWAPRR